MSRSNFNAFIYGRQVNSGGKTALCGKKKKSRRIKRGNKRKGWISIRTREKTLVDLEVFPGDEGRLKERCRDLKPGSIPSSTTAQKRGSWPREGRMRVYYQRGRGIPHTDKKGWNIPVTEDDFYSYKRGTMAKFYHWLRMTGQWKA